VDVASKEGAPWLTIGTATIIVAVAHFVTGWFPTEATIRPVAFSRTAMAEGRWWTLLTSLFAHGGLIHLLGNTITLLALGPVFERELGRARFLLTYLGAGIAGNLAHVAFHADLPVVGASGAIFGLLGLLLILDPRAEITVLIVDLPIVVFAGLYAAAAPILIRLQPLVPIAHEAHLGGMAFGALLAFLFRPRRALWFVPGILVVFWGIQLLLVRLLTFDYGRVPERPESLWVFIPPILVWAAGSAYIAWAYRRQGA
jgi:membrane associated rhomboid family serine protease